MPDKTRKYSRTAKTQPKTVMARTPLQDRPEQELLSLQEAIHQLRGPLEAAITKGYSYQELAAMLHQRGISIGAAALKSHLTSGKNSRSLVSRLESKSSKNSLEQAGKPSKTFLETARSLSLQGPPDWSEKIDQYL